MLRDKSDNGASAEQLAEYIDGMLDDKGEFLRWKAMQKRHAGEYGAVLSRNACRDFCVRCGEPLRVSQERLKVMNYCEDCSPDHRGIATPYGWKEDSPWQQNAIRDMEG